MKPAATAKGKTASNTINRYAYALFLIFVVYLTIKGDYEWAVINLGIALVFDPFDAAMQWRDRPLYQKVWLLTHVLLTFAGFAFLLLR